MSNPDRPPETPVRPPAREFSPSEQASIDQMREKADGLRQEHIDRLNAERPTPSLVMNYTPSGPVVEEVHAPENANRNAEIDNDVKRFKDWINKSQGKAREDFNLAHDGPGEKKL